MVFLSVFIKSVTATKKVVLTVVFVTKRFSNGTLMFLIDEECRYSYDAIIQQY